MQEKPGGKRASMERGGSTVRVRQRALEKGKSPQSADFCCLTQHHRAPPLVVAIALELSARFANACKSESFPVRRSTSVKRRASTRWPRPGESKLAGKG